MRIRLAAALVLLVLMAPAVRAAPGLVLQRGPELQAWLYERKLEHRRQPVQILVRLCDVPRYENGCVSMPHDLRRAIEAEVAVRFGQHQRQPQRDRRQPGRAGDVAAAAEHGLRAAPAQRSARSRNGAGGKRESARGAERV